MNYEFPLIRTIDDVLPHIHGSEEFIVAEREFGTVINYNVVTPTTFPPIKVSDGSARMRAERAYTNAVRRECRGIKFYPDGRIAARTFHKWFNVNEREETLVKNIDFSKRHYVEHKLDGSMIHPMLVNGYVRWMTKMGITEVSMQAEEYVAKHPNYVDFATWCISNNLTPSFEWCSRKQRIVVDYPEDSLTLLAVRDNYTGEYKNVR